MGRLTVLPLSRERRESDVAFSHSQCAPLVGLQRRVMPLLRKAERRAQVDGFLGCSEIFSRYIHARFVPLMAVKIERNTPFVFRKVAKAAEMNRGRAKSLKVVFFGFPSGGQYGLRRKCRLLKSVDVAKLASKRNFDRTEGTLPMPGCLGENTPRDSSLNDRRDCLAT